MAAVATDARDRRIRDEGTTAEADWLAWLAADPPPSLALDELLDASQRLVVVSPHPDDEVLACGGLIALHTARGGRTAIVAVTDGEASHRGDPAWPAARLARARRAERQLGLAQLGLGAETVTRLALPDSAVADRCAHLQDALTARLRPTDCVVATWRLDGHPDHDATGAAAAQACSQTGCRLVEAPVWMWQWSWPGDERVPWHRLRALPLPADALSSKRAALAAHATQLAARASAPAVLGPAIVARAARRADYFLV